MIVTEMLSPELILSVHLQQYIAACSTTRTGLSGRDLGILLLAPGND